MNNGWYKESYRHGLAARGIKTSYYAQKRRYNYVGGAVALGRAFLPRAAAYSRGLLAGARGATSAARVAQATTAVERAAAASKAAQVSEAGLLATMKAAPRGFTTVVRQAGTKGTVVGRAIVGGKYSPIRIVRAYPKTSIGVVAYGAGTQRALRGVPGEGAIAGISDIIVPGPSPEAAAAAAATGGATGTGLAGSRFGLKDAIGGAAAIGAGALLLGVAKKKSEEADQAAVIADQAAMQEAQLRAEESALLARADQLRVDAAKVARRQREAVAERRYEVMMDPAEEAEALAIMEDQRLVADWNRARLDEAKLKREVREMKAARTM
jgi:hypothetical protein